ncbi:AI-2E family transporter [Haloarchaeobius sp. HRN-SO-5]|uniref:AI-2E family transporter n=1 Tax=Haloarchaeobius sp. HRN-SO-5 TaxID=3446118 RepID=UPI003EBFBCDF
MNVAGQRGGRTAVWVGLGAVIALVVALALFRYLGTLLFAIFLYYATRPIYRRLDRYSDHPDLTTTVTILVVVVPMLAVVVYAGVLGLRELDQFLATDVFQSYRSMLDPYLTLAREGELRRLWSALLTDPERSVSPAVQEVLRSVVGPIQTLAGLAFALGSRLFLLLVFLFYLLRDDQKLRSWFYRSIDDDERLVAFAEAVDDDLEAVFVGNLAIVVVAAVTAAVTYYGLNVFARGSAVVGIPLLLSLLIGIGTLVPVVGMKLVYLPFGAYLLASSLATQRPLWHAVAFLVLTFTVVDTVPDFLGRAFLSSRSGIHMGLVLIGYVLGTMAFGWYGLFLGPLVVVLAVHFGTEVFPDLASRLLGT